MSLHVNQLIGFAFSSSIPFSVNSRNSNSETSLTSHSVSLPAGMVDGSMLILFIHIEASATISVAPSGYTQLGTTSTGSTSTDARLYVYYKTVAGDGASIGYTTSSSVASAHVAIAINNVIGVPEIGSFATGLSTTPNSPTVAPTWGNNRQLFITAAAVAANVVASGVPAGYSNHTSAVNAGNNVAMNTAEKIQTSAADDAPDWTSTSNKWVAVAVVVH